MTRLALSRASLLALALSVSAVAAPAIAQDAPHQHAAPPPPSPAPTASPAAPADHAGMDMSGMDMSGAGTPAGGMTMDMGRMQGGKAPPDARNSDDYADGYRNSRVLRFTAQDVAFTGGSDILAEYIQVSCFAILAIIGAATWSLLDRRRAGHERLRLQHAGVVDERVDVSQVRIDLSEQPDDIVFP